MKIYQHDSKMIPKYIVMLVILPDFVIRAENFSATLRRISNSTITFNFYLMKGCYNFFHPSNGFHRNYSDRYSTAISNLYGLIIIITITDNIPKLVIQIHVTLICLALHPFSAVH